MGRVKGFSQVKLGALWAVATSAALITGCTNNASDSSSDVRLGLPDWQNFSKAVVAQRKGAPLEAKFAAKSGIDANSSKLSGATVEAQAAVGAFASQVFVIERVMANMQGPGLPGPIVSIWDSNGQAGVPPDSFSFPSVPRGAGRLIQVLIAGTMKETSSAPVQDSSQGQMIIYYGEVLQDINSNVVEVGITVRPAGQINVQGNIIGRYLATPSWGPSGKVNIMFKPPSSESPPMVVDSTMMYGGWVRLFSAPGVQFRYVMENGVDLFGDRTVADPSLVPDNRAARVTVPLSYVQQSGGSSQRYERSPQLSVIGFFGPASGGKSAVFRQPAAGTVESIGDATSSMLYDSPSGGNPVPWLGNAGGNGGRVEAGGYPIGMNTPLPADGGPNEEWRDFVVLDHKALTYGDGALRMNGPFRTWRDTSGMTQGPFSYSTSSGKVVLNWKYLPGAHVRDAGIINGIAIFVRDLAASESSDDIRRALQGGGDGISCDLLPRFGFVEKARVDSEVFDTGIVPPSTAASSGSNNGGLPYMFVGCPYSNASAGRLFPGIVAYGSWSQSGSGGGGSGNNNVDPNVKSLGIYRLSDSNFSTSSIPKVQAGAAPSGSISASSGRLSLPQGVCVPFQVAALDNSSKPISTPSTLTISGGSTNQGAVLFYWSSDCSGTGSQELNISNGSRIGSQLLWAKWLGAGGAGSAAPIKLSGPNNLETTAGVSLDSAFGSFPGSAGDIGLRISSPRGTAVKGYGCYPIHYELVTSSGGNPVSPNSYWYANLPSSSGYYYKDDRCAGGSWSSLTLDGGINPGISSGTFYFRPNVITGSQDLKPTYSYDGGSNIASASSSLVLNFADPGYATKLRLSAMGLQGLPITGECANVIVETVNSNDEPAPFPGGSGGTISVNATDSASAAQSSLFGNSYCNSGASSSSSYSFTSTDTVKSNVWISLPSGGLSRISATASGLASATSDLNWGMAFAQRIYARFSTQSLGSPGPTSTPFLSGNPPLLQLGRPFTLVLRAVSQVGAWFNGYTFPAAESNGQPGFQPNLGGLSCGAPSLNAGTGELSIPCTSSNVGQNTLTLVSPGGGGPQLTSNSFIVSNILPQTNGLIARSGAVGWGTDAVCQPALIMSSHNDGSHDFPVPMSSAPNYTLGTTSTGWYRDSSCSTSIVTGQNINVALPSLAAADAGAQIAYVKNVGASLYPTLINGVNLKNSAGSDAATPGASSAAGSAYQLQMATSNYAYQGSCLPVLLYPADNSGSVAPAISACSSPVYLSGGTGPYSDSLCTNSTSVSWSPGDTEKLFYMRVGSSSGSFNLNAPAANCGTSGSSIYGVNLNINVVAP